MFGTIIFVLLAVHSLFCMRQIEHSTRQLAIKLLEIYKTKNAIVYENIFLYLCKIKWNNCSYNLSLNCSNNLCLWCKCIAFMCDECEMKYFHDSLMELCGNWVLTGKHHFAPKWITYIAIISMTARQLHSKTITYEHEVRIPEQIS